MPGSERRSQRQLLQERTLSEVIHAAINLPWPKLASWMVATLAFYQLRDFFGVCTGL